MRKISFVEPKAPWLVRPFAQVPLGPLYLATYLNKHGYNADYVRLWDKSEIDKIEDSDVVAFSGTTLEHHVALDYARTIKKRWPNKILWYGGNHATAMPEETIKEVWDSVGICEGENYILEMAEDSFDNEPKQLYQSNKLTELDNVPYPDRTLIKGSHGSGIFAFGQDYKGSGNENVITSRGCPFSCAFCSSENMWGKSVRFRAPEHIIEELVYIDNNFDQKQIRFADDSFTSRPLKDLEEVCKYLNDIGSVWRCSVRADSLSEDVCELLSMGGCKEVSVGIESADQRVLDFLNKNTNIDDMIEGVQQAHDKGITVRALMMIGTPGERGDTPELNRELINLEYIDCVTLSTFVPLPGSPICDDPEGFKSKIMDYDFSKYNRDFWVKSEKGGKVKRKVNLLIRNLLLTRNRQIDNIERMEQYLLESGKTNQG